MHEMMYLRIYFFIHLSYVNVLFILNVLSSDVDDFFHDNFICLEDFDEDVYLKTSFKCLR